MKLKGVNAFEQHVEKIVLVAVSVVFLVVLAMQFLLEPNKVKVAGGQAVPPGKAFVAIETKAKELQGKMASTHMEGLLPAAPKYDLVKQLESRRTASLVNSGTNVAFGASAAIEGVSAAAGPVGNEKISPLVVPAPTRAIAASYRNTFDPTDPINIPELKPLLPKEQPMDKVAVSVAANFSGAALKTALTEAAGDAKPIPTTWWRDGIEILGVQLERQEQKSDGSWGQVAAVASAPGRYTLADQLKQVRSTTDLLDVVTEARSASEDILRPQYYRTIAGPEWKPPTAAGLSIDAAKAPAEVQALLRRRQGESDKLDRLIKSREAEEKKTVRQPSPGGGGGGGGGGRGRGGAGGGDSGGGRNIQQDLQKDKQNKLDNFDRLIKEAQTALADFDAKLKELGYDSTGKPLSPAAEPTSPGEVVRAKPLLDEPEVKMWAHDLTVEAGKTYRYRVKVAVNNPAFSRTSALIPEQQDMAASALTYSQPSEWSEPVHVLADRYYFITSASEADNLGPARATAEVFEYFYGYYRRGAVNLEPGDIIATNIKLPDPNKLPIYDLEKLKDGIQPAQPGTPTPPPGNRPPDERSGRGGGGGGGKGGRLANQPENAPEVTQQQQQQQAKAVLPPNSKPYGKTSLAAAIEVIMLDVAQTLGSGDSGPRPQVYLADPSGAIVSVVPEEVRKQAVYAAVVQSAVEGENQGQPAVPTSEPGKEKPKEPTPPKAPKTPPPSSGGGGGGTG